MRINHNIGALNTYRQLSSNTQATSKSMEKLSSGLRINRAGDDAAGLAISEKMRGQIRGLDQASRNAQDAISLVQTAEGALNETHDILQRMRELANQSANGTNVTADRGAIQDEINQLSSEINRIGNTTQFNTQSLLKGDSKVNLASTKVVTDGNLAGGLTTHTQATQTVTVTAAAAANDTFSVTLNGQKLDLNFTASGSNGGTVNDGKGYNVTGNTASVAIDAAPTLNTTAAATANALQKMIDSNENLKGAFTATVAGADVIISAVAGGKFDGAAGNMTAAASTGTLAMTGNAPSVGTTTKTAAFKTTDLSSLQGATAAETDANLKALVGKGMTINGQQVEFYNSNDGAYTGKGLGVDISSALYETTNANKTTALASTVAATLGNKIDGVTVTSTGDDIVITAKTAGEAGNNISVADGGKQKDFSTTFQIGANNGQSMTLNIADMRSEALGITAKAGTAGFSAANNVTDGTTDNKGEAALDVSSKENAAKALDVLDKAIQSVSSQRGVLGSVQNRLEHTINNLNTSSENLTAAESRIRDVDMAKEMMQQSKSNILSQAAQAMLAQANQQPQGVLQLLRG